MQVCKYVVYSIYLKHSLGLTIYGKDEMTDLTAEQKRILKAVLEKEVDEHGKA